MDDNPFADPKVNPFSDPSVQQASAGSAAVPKLDDYNPFADGGNVTKPVSTGVTSPTPAQLPVGAPPPYTTSAATPAVTTPQANTAELQARQQELERKAQELERKEQELVKNQEGIARVNNWPPLPCKCIPKCFYQDFDVDIVPEFQRIVRLLYYLWFGYFIVLFLNVIGALAYLIADQASTSGGQTFGLAILYWLLFTPCSFICWFRPVYKAFRSESSFNFFLFFFVFFFQFIANIVMAIGIPGGGFCGMISGLTLIGQKSPASTTIGVIMLVIGILYALMAVADIVLLIRVNRIYRSSGASFQDAQREFTSGVMQSQTVQQATQQAAASAVQSGMQDAMGNGTENRY